MVEIRFRAHVDEEKCVSCPMCANVCPTAAIPLPGRGEKAHVLEERCVGCPNCSGVCPVDAISMKERTYDGLSFARRPFERSE